MACTWGDCRRSPSPNEWALISEFCTDHQVLRADVSKDPKCVGMAEAVDCVGNTIAGPATMSECAEADVGDTGIYGLALIGSPVVGSRRAGGGRLRFRPPLHVALGRREAIPRCQGALFRLLDDKISDGLQPEPRPDHRPEQVRRHRTTARIRGARARGIVIGLRLTAANRSRMPRDGAAGSGPHPQLVAGGTRGARRSGAVQARIHPIPNTRWK
jgi:hypothetical protein